MSQNKDPGSELILASLRKEESLFLLFVCLEAQNCEVRYADRLPCSYSQYLEYSAYMSFLHFITWLTEAPGFTRYHFFLVWVCAILHHIAPKFKRMAVLYT